MTRRPGLVAALIILVTGVWFAVAQPPVWGADEPAHLYRAWQVSSGGMLPLKTGEHDGLPEYGGSIPTGLVDLAESGTTRQWSKPGRSPVAGDWAARQALMRAPVGPATTQIGFVNSAAYAPVSYAPAVVGLWLARALHLDAGGTVYAARLAGVVAAALAAWLALSLLRETGWELVGFVVACLPSAIFQAGSISADTMTNATALVLGAAFLRLALSDAPPTWLATWALAVSTVLAAVVKPTYAVLALLLLAVPADRLRWRRPGASDAPLAPVRARIGLWVTLLVALATAAAWLRVAADTTRGMGVVRGAAEEHLVRPGDQQSYLLHHLTAVPGLVYRTLADYAPKYLREVFVQTGYQVEGSGLAMVLVLMALAVAWFAAPRPVASRRVVAWSATVLLGATAAVFLALYLSFTPVGLWVISGVQGRYFLPLLLLSLAVLRPLVPLRLAADARLGETSAQGEPSTPGQASAHHESGDQASIMAARAGRVVLVLVVGAALLAIAKFTLLMWVSVS